MSGVIIFGGSGGIGRSIARDLVKRDIPVCLAARNEESLAAAASEVGAAGYVVADATDLKQIEDAFTAANAMLGSIKGVAHCVGSIVLKPAHLTTEAEFMSVAYSQKIGHLFAERSATPGQPVDNLVIPVFTSL